MSLCARKLSLTLLKAIAFQPVAKWTYQETSTSGKPSPLAADGSLCIYTPAHSPWREREKGFSHRAKVHLPTVGTDLKTVPLGITFLFLSVLSFPNTLLALEWFF